MPDRVEDRPALNQLHLRQVLRRAIRVGVKVDPQAMLDIMDGKGRA